MTLKTLPGKYENCAPQWDEKVESLENFWEDLEILFAEFKVEDNRKVDTASRYAPGSEVKYWKDTIKELELSDRVKWDKVKKAISQIYPGATPETCGYDDLVTLVESMASRRMIHYGNYYDYLKRFKNLATQLANAGKNLGTWQKSQMLITGIPQPLRERVERQLWLISPAHMPGTPWKVDKINTAVKIVLAEQSEMHATNFIDRDEPSTPETLTRTVFDSSKQSTLSNSLQLPNMETLALIISTMVEKVLAAKTTSLSVSTPQSSPATYPNNIQQSYPPRP
ncbi:hypothetical protein FA15DRAFT_711501 [Coprinopsis marcescibilis]|uniref:Retrotransposon gag domain-containing protein n=1 Tax=Coprinopsis marcescibilis TaxID=230819 RepID=A0A5C3K9F8_COPMA|nr:hypothetical protein FA15DRAFT_711501 [Coprinopsis marcescibilis]